MVLNAVGPRRPKEYQNVIQWYEESVINALDESNFARFFNSSLSSQEESSLAKHVAEKPWNPPGSTSKND